MRDGDNSGVAAHPNQSGPLRVGPPGGPPVPLRLNLLVEQKAALVGFLKILLTSRSPTIRSSKTRSNTGIESYDVVNTSLRACFTMQFV